MIETVAHRRAGTAVAAMPGSSETARSTAVVQIGALVVVATGLWAALALNMAGPWVVPDEFIYSGLARSIAAGHLPALRGVTTLGYGVGYPLLVAPAWVLAGSAVLAYKLALVINAALMSLAAVPAYLLARRFLSHRSSLFVASLTLLVPAMAFTSMLLTENAYYPAFLVSLLAIVRALERATLRRQIVALAFIVLTLTVKLLGVVLVPVFLTAVLVDAAIRGASVRACVRAYRLTFAGSALGIVVAVIASAAAGRGATGALGAYAAVFDKLDPASIPWSFVLHAAALDLTSGFVPFAATLLVLVQATRRVVRDDVVVRFAAIAVASLVWIPLAVAVSSGAIRAGSAGAGANAHLHERYVFVLSPLLLVGVGVALERGFSRRGRAGTATAVVAAALAVLIPVAHLSDNAALQAPSLILWLLFAHGQVALGVAAFVLVMLYARGMSKRSSLCWAVVAVVLATGALLASAASYGKGDAVTAAGVGAARTWVDSAAGRRGDVSILWNEPGRRDRPARPRAAQNVVWVDEFFNRSVRRVFALGAADPEGLPQIPVRVDPRGILVERDGPVVRAAFVLTCGVRLAAPLVARNPDTGARLYRVDGPVRVSQVAPSTCVGRSRAGAEAGP